MAEVTNETEAVCAAGQDPDKSEYDTDMGYHLRPRISYDAWKEGVSELLVKSAYLDRGYGFINQESRVVYSVTK